MTTKSHQPEFVAEIIGKTLDHLIDDRKRVAVSFELAENGCMEETHVSLKRRIAAMWGFQTSGIELLEASTTWFELGGMQFNVYSSVQFSVNGKGWKLDPKFRDFIPKLVEFTGQMLNIHVYDDQEVMFVDRDTGEVAYEDAPLLLPGVAGE